MISQLTFTPFISWPLLTFFGVLGLVLIGLSVWQRARGITLRIIGFAVLYLVLLNPHIIQEKRTPQPDIAIAIVDESPSQVIEGRRQQNEKTLKVLRDVVDLHKNLKLKVVRVQATDADKEVATRQNENDKWDAIPRQPQT